MSVVFLSLLLISELVQQAGCSDEFYDVLKHFQNLENLYVEHYEEKTAYLLPSKLLKQHSPNSHDQIF